MSVKKDFSDIFDDDFEVTYEDEKGMTVDITGNTQRNDVSRTQKTVISGYDTGFDDGYEDDDDYEDDKYEDRSQNSGGRKRYKSRGVPLAAPIRKGGRTLSRLTAALVRSLTAVLILVILVYVTWTFWRASSPYGDIVEMIRTRQTSMVLASYLCVAALFILFELISLFWSMTRGQVRTGRDSWKEDKGRGLFSFILVFFSSYLAFFISPFLPEAPDAVYGVKGALDVYGSMHNVLFGLCTAGVISCIVRKYFA